MKVNNRSHVPQARKAMDKFKMQAASEVVVNLTSRKAGSVGGRAVRKMCPIRTARYARECTTASVHVQKVRYITSISV